MITSLPVIQTPWPVAPWLHLQVGMDDGPAPEGCPICRAEEHEENACPETGREAPRRRT